MKLAAQPNTKQPAQPAAERTKTKRDTHTSALADNRPETAQLKKLQASANRSPSHPIQKKENNTGLPDNLKTGVENLSGHSFDDVKVHYNSAKPALLQAHAYAQGTDIHVAPGQEKHLPHEAWHVAQQKQGRVQPTKQLKGKGVAINDNHALEHEAGLMGHKALQKKGVDEEEEKHTTQLRAAGGTSAVVQRVKFERISGSKFGFMKSYTTTETEILDLEKRLADFFDSMSDQKQEINETGTQMKALYNRFESIENATVKQVHYPQVLEMLKKIHYDLDNLSSKIALGHIKYGSGSQDMIAHTLKKPKDRKPGQDRLFAFITKKIDALPPEFRVDKNRTVLSEALAPGNVLSTPDVGDYDLNFAKRQARVLFANFDQILQRVRKDWPQLKSKFGLQGQLKHVELTGSDFHKGAQQVVIIEDTKGKKVVYKPRSTSPDSAILGSPNKKKTGGGLFHKLNKLGNGKVKLPTMKFLEKEDEQSEYSYVEFAQKSGRKSVDEAREYYYRMGQMSVASKLLGMKDLHRDNVMSTRNSPTIIDAETALQPFTLNAKSFASTEITMALEKFSEGKERGNNRFIVEGEEVTWEKMGTQQKALHHDEFENFVDHCRKNDLKQGGAYRGNFTQGINDIVAVIQKERPKIIQMVLEKAKQTKNIRVVPIPTTDFRGYINGYHAIAKSGHVGNKTRQLGGITDLAINGLHGEGFYKITQGRRAVISAGLDVDMNKRDLPIFHFEPATNQVFYHGKVVGKNRFWENPRELIGKTIDSILELDTGQMMKALGL